MPLALAAAGLGFALSAIVHELCDIREEKSLQPTNYHPQPVSSRTKFQPPASQTNTGTASGRLQTRKHRGFAVSPTDPTLTLVKTFPSFDPYLPNYTDGGLVTQPRKKSWESGTPPRAQWEMELQRRPPYEYHQTHLYDFSSPAFGKELTCYRPDPICQATRSGRQCCYDKHRPPGRFYARGGRPRLEY